MESALFSKLFLNPAIVTGALFVYYSSLSLYRLFLHPLRSFPGDPFAALSGWHWDIHASDSDYLRRLHQIYGPVVRIGPNNLHFSDHKAYHDIYAAGSRFTKDPGFYATFGADEASLGIIDPKSSKTRRDILSPLFSRRAILKLENVIQAKVDILIAQIFAHEKRPVDLYYAFRSTSLDIITSYCFAESWSTLMHPAFQHPMLRGMDEGSRLFWIMHAFPALQWILLIVEPVVVNLSTKAKVALAFRSYLAAQINKLLKDPELLDSVEHETVYHHLMQPGRSQSHIPSRKSLLEESVTLMFAGSETVANTLNVGTFHVLHDERILAMLFQELQHQWPEGDSRMSYDKLEKLPYLTAVIKESLRLSVGIVSPMPRIVGPSSVTIAGVVVPEGTSVSICTTFIHYNPDIFSEPAKFLPERWLEPNSHYLDNYLVPFSKGPRSCIGTNLAWCELYLIFGNIFRRLDMKLHEASIEDLKYSAYFVPVYTGNHLRARVQKRLEISVDGEV